MLFQRNIKQYNGDYSIKALLTTCTSEIFSNETSSHSCFVSLKHSLNVLEKISDHGLEQPINMYNLAWPNVG